MKEAQQLILANYFIFIMDTSKYEEKGIEKIIEFLFQKQIGQCSLCQKFLLINIQDKTKIIMIGTMAQLPAYIKIKILLDVPGLVLLIHSEKI